ncbi:hypothetical protein NDU88_003303 [Pleurodeles waltl]|uniref:Uncharacterized protein n=1 Tax=Pleurodeles waltl TaxID=8319 RepID=A0AAV7TN19_PLEWA|nr:hypothetical protein NDU88_003303 [Pleurodeles waltl]
MVTVESPSSGSQKPQQVLPGRVKQQEVPVLPAVRLHPLRHSAWSHDRGPLRLALGGLHNSAQRPCDSLQEFVPTIF